MPVTKLFCFIAPCIFITLQFSDNLKSVFQQLGILIVATVGAWICALYIKQETSKLSKVSPDRRAVLVAGCDSESGYIATSELAKYGYMVFGGARIISTDLCDNLRRRSVDVMELNVDTDEAVGKLVGDISHKLSQRDVKLHAVVCNLADAVLGETEWVASTSVSSAMELSVVGTMRLIRAFLPLLRDSNGRIVICSGLSGRVGVPGAVLYSVVNAALICLADCLRREMIKFRVQVTVVEPLWLNYRTPVPLLDNLKSKLNEVINNLSFQVYDQYREYIHHFKDLWNRRILRWYSGPADRISVALCDAVNDTDVESRYVTALPLERCTFLLLEHLPPAVADIVLCFLYQPHVQIPGLDDSDQNGAGVTSPLIRTPSRIQMLVSQLISPAAGQDQDTPISTPAVEAQIMRERALGARYHIPERYDLEGGSASSSPWVSMQSEEWKPCRISGSASALTSPTPPPLKLSEPEISSPLSLMRASDQKTLKKDFKLHPALRSSMRASRNSLSPKPAPSDTEPELPFQRSTAQAEEKSQFESPKAQPELSSWPSKDVRVKSLESHKPHATAPLEYKRRESYAFEASPDSTNVSSPDDGCISPMKQLVPCADTISGQNIIVEANAEGRASSVSPLRSDPPRPKEVLKAAKEDNFSKHNPHLEEPSQRVPISPEDDQPSSPVKRTSLLSNNTVADALSEQGNSKKDPGNPAVVDDTQQYVDMFGL
ncbi:uncharacterized protein LOC135383094 [Ornithodoros turicata]|uniref:uncharacterized protein LOC135383094 n=1 Tax=Ornithodoros turicata TaxID=34597 RepID=UPI00313A3714